jgi:serine/threonine protein phosphatase PrpC
MSDVRRSRHQAVIPNGPLVLNIAACSDIGSVRTENQDAWSIHPMDEQRPGAVVILADGMGGHADGAVASYLAVTASTEVLRSALDPHAALLEAVRDANAAIAQRRAEHGGAVSGTTLVVVVVTETRATIANVGDSRAYLVRGTDAQQVTADHSWVAEQIRAGLLPPEAARGDARRNLLTRALTGEPVQPDGFHLELNVGDCLVLCSDGAWDVIGGEGLADRFAPTVDLLQAVEQAVDDSIEGGSTDNVTVVACRIQARQSTPGESTNAFVPLPGPTPTLETDAAAIHTVAPPQHDVPAAG